MKSGGAVDLHLRVDASFTIVLFGHRGEGKRNESEHITLRDLRKSSCFVSDLGSTGLLTRTVQHSTE